MTRLSRLLDDVASGSLPDRATALALAAVEDPAELCRAAEAMTLGHHGRRVSYSRKVFIPLTRLCRDVCHYCTFASAPRALPRPYLAPAQVLDIARAGAAAGCREALFTLGDKPELRYPAARRALAALGYETTLDYLEEVAGRVLAETGLLPHLNCGVMGRDELARLRPVAASMGLMLESSAQRLCERGGPHWGSPDKRPAVRLATIRAAGELGIPFTSGLLVGIGETRAERVESLLALRDLHAEHGHLQELIIQNFRAKPGTRMADAPEPPLAEQLWTVAVARLLFGPAMNIQAPPNLRAEGLRELVGAGINDWGGVSPVTPDHVNPEAPWPELAALAEATAAADRVLAERLTIYPAYARQPARWLDERLRTPVLRHADAEGLARADAWYAGMRCKLPADVVAELRKVDVAELRKVDVAQPRGSEVMAEPRGPGPAVGPRDAEPVPNRQRPAPSAGRAPLARLLARAAYGDTLGEDELAGLFAARGEELRAVVRAADELRREAVGEAVSFVVNRNINYTNVCRYKCGFCAFSKGRTAEALRGRPYDLDPAEIARRVAEAWQRGATEVCLQGGIHPDYTGDTYLEVLRIVKGAAPDVHVHAFSPLEVSHGARTLGISTREFLAELKRAGLASLPGTAAEILDDEVRAIICPDKLDTAGWLGVMRDAHAVGLRSTATIMFGHVDGYRHWARHLLRVRAQQAASGGFTEFVPLPFVHAEAPLWRRGRARSGPSFREALLMHAVARLALHPLIANVQASWVKMGPAGVAHCLDAGANDLGGVLMNESITRAAGGAHGQEMDVASLESLVRSVGRVPRQRSTLYGAVGAARLAAARAAAPLAEVVNTPLARHSRPATVQAV